jgi:hypothetical protein
MLKIDSKSWQEGFAAGEKMLSNCPYPPVTLQARSWWSGYVEGDAKRQGYEYSNPIERAQEKSGGQ